MQHILFCPERTRAVFISVLYFFNVTNIEVRCMVLERWMLYACVLFSSVLANPWH